MQWPELEHAHKDVKKTGKFDIVVQVDSHECVNCWTGSHTTKKCHIQVSFVFLHTICALMVVTNWKCVCVCVCVFFCADYIVSERSRLCHSRVLVGQEEIADRRTLSDQQREATVTDTTLSDAVRYPQKTNEL